ncbi:MAG: YihY/virulence factor BrkB family protein [Chloroflexi bacterium]|nr:YihY/virulence factor BrkB family protein [Chloroflexota bacterium]
MWVTLAVRARWTRRDAQLLVKRTFKDFAEDHCTQLAAGISYYVLFSIFPLAIFLVGLSGLVLRNDALRADLLDGLIGALPLAEAEARADIEQSLDGLGRGFSVAALVGLGGLLWSASGMMGALRFALNQAWDSDYRRPFVIAKAVDLLMVASVGVLLAASIAATVLMQVARRVSGGLSDWLGPLGSGATFGVEFVALFVPLLISFATFLVVFKIVPSVRTRFAHVWPGALFSALLFELVKNGFAIYLRYFGNYDALYGSLGAAIAFLFFVYISAIVLLLGAEMAAEWPRVTHGWYDDAPAAEPVAGKRGGLAGFLLGLVRGERSAPVAVEDTAIAERRRERVEAEIARRLEA